MWRIQKTMQKRLKILFLPTLLLFVGLAPATFSGCGETTETGGQESTQLWTCGMHPQVLMNEPGDCPICGMKLTPLTADTAGYTKQHAEGVAEHTHSTTESSTPSQSPADHKGKKILYWRAPMDPTYISDKPGKSPMGMDLIPVYEGEEPSGAGRTIRIDPFVILDIGVKTAPVEVKRLRREIRTVAHVDYCEERIYRVNLKFDGWVEKLFVNETGQQVRKGQPLLEVYSPGLLATQEEYLLAVQNAAKLLESDREDIRRSGEQLRRAARQRLLLWDITEEQIAELERTGRTRKTLTLYAPHDGIVIEKNVEEGMRVMPRMDLYRVADLSVVWVYAHLFEYEIPWVKVGDEAEMELPYIPGKVFKGRVRYIYPYLDKKTRDVKVRLEVPNPQLALKPEMYVNVRFSSEMPEPTPVIPSEAVIRSGKRNIVFLALGDGKFAPREVVLGAEGENNAFQVLSGLNGGETIVTSAQFLLDSESRLQEAIQKMLEERLQKRGSHEPKG